MRNFLIILITVALVGCATVKNIQEVDEIASGPEGIAVVKSVSLTAAEYQLVDHAYSTYARIKSKWETQLDYHNVAELLVKSDELDEDYALLHRQYNIVTKIVMRNISKYSHEDSLYMTNAANKFRAMHASYLKAKRINDFVEGAKIIIKASLAAAAIIER